MTETTEVVRPLTKAAALAKWEQLFDRHIGVGAPLEHRIDGLIAAGATEESLKQFWRETKHLSWPATWGESPWETASSLGAAFCFEEEHSNTTEYGRKYVEAFRQAQAAATAVERPAPPRLKA